jgi:patatin-like phospholipase/acyl hydrolase
MARKLILSIDGGGIRGIIPACALVRLEQLTGKPARETFAFAAGTSTGALIGAAVAAGLPATRILDIYLNRAREIFSPAPPWNTAKRVVFGSMYCTATLRRVLAEELGEASGWTLNDSPIDLLISAKRVSDGKPWYFVRDNPKNSKTTGRLNLVDCATASAAAPTYFEPLPMQDPVSGALVDGGVGVTGNPVYQACVEAFYYHDSYVPAETVVVSLGTGRYISVQDPAGLLGWLTWVLDTVLQAPEEQQTEIVKRHFVPQGLILYRRDFTLRENIPMDDVGSIHKLRGYGEEFAKDVPWEEILALC